MIGSLQRLPGALRVRPASRARLCGTPAWNFAANRNTSAMERAAAPVHVPNVREGRRTLHPRLPRRTATTTSDPETLARMEANGQIAFRYCDARAATVTHRTPTRTGRWNNIAGVDERGRKRARASCRTRSAWWRRRWAARTVCVSCARIRRGPSRRGTPPGRRVNERSVSLLAHGSRRSAFGAGDVLARKALNSLSPGNVLTVTASASLVARRRWWEWWRSVLGIVTILQPRGLRRSAGCRAGGPGHS